MAQTPIIAIASKGLAQHRKVAILAACFPEWEHLKTIDEPESGIARMTIDADTPVEFYMPAGSISGVRFSD